METITSRVNSLYGIYRLRTSIDVIFIKDNVNKRNFFTYTIMVNRWIVYEINYNNGLAKKNVVTKKIIDYKFHIG